MPRGSRPGVPRLPAITERRELLAIGMQRCSTCKETWPLAAFSRSASSTSGYSSRCRPCDAHRRAEERGSPGPGLDYRRRRLGLRQQSIAALFAARQAELTARGPAVPAELPECAGCEPVWTVGGFRHDPACALRRLPLAVNGR